MSKRLFYFHCWKMLKKVKKTRIPDMYVSQC